MLTLSDLIQFGIFIVALITLVIMTMRNNK